MSQIITFYSYKGGVGRTMALANVATLLAKWGYRTLIVDWDLEAPGLENFFNEYIDASKISKNQKGIVDLLTSHMSKNKKKVDWKGLVVPISIPKIRQKIYLITAGQRDEEYFKKVREFDVTKFYDNYDGGNFIENLRDSWKESFDFILIDSRTGVTEIGGICTIQLPDINIMLFTPTQHGLNGILDIAKRARIAHQKLPVERQKLVFLPIPTRLDTNTEFIINQSWIDKFAHELTPLYNDWLPIEGNNDVKIDKKVFIEKTKIPYVPYFSYGEKLPVIEQGTTDTAGLGYAYENLAGLIVEGLTNVELFYERREEFIEKCIPSKSESDRLFAESLKFSFSNSLEKALAVNKSRVIKKVHPVNVLFYYQDMDKGFYREIREYVEHLNTGRKVKFYSEDDIILGQSKDKEIPRLIEIADVIIIIFASGNIYQNTFGYIINEANNKTIVPINVTVNGTHRTEMPNWLSSFQSLTLNRKPGGKYEYIDEAVEKLEKLFELKRKEKIKIS
jgi:hypothetical protein